MGFCESKGEQVVLKGENSNRNVFICNAGVGVIGEDISGQPINYCPFSTLFSAREGCLSLNEPVSVNIMETVRVEWIEGS